MLRIKNLARSTRSLRTPLIRSSTLIRSIQSSSIVSASALNQSDSKVSSGSSSFHKAPKLISNKTDRPSIVILGSGWGAISFLKHIDSTKYNVIIISPRNYFLFTPLLPSCPVGTVDEKSIMEPVVSFANKKKGDVTYYEAEATDINPNDKTVTIKSFSNINTTVTSADGVGINVGLKANEIAQISYD